MFSFTTKIEFSSIEFSLKSHTLLRERRLTKVLMLLCSLIYEEWGLVNLIRECILNHW